MTAQDWRVALIIGVPTLAFTFLAFALERMDRTITSVERNAGRVVDMRRSRS